MSQKRKEIDVGACSLLILIFDVPKEWWPRKRKQGRESHWGRKKTHWIATLPSIEPRAYPSALGNREIVLVCHFNGEVTVYRKETQRVFHNEPSVQNGRWTRREIKHQLCKA